MNVKQENRIELLFFFVQSNSNEPFWCLLTFEKIIDLVYFIDSTPTLVDGMCFDVMFIESITFAIFSSAPLAMCGAANKSE